LRQQRRALGDSHPLYPDIAQRILIEIMKSAKLPREQNPYLLTGRGRKKRWFFLRAKTAKPESEI
jgi:hypothetical protein